ncbi:MAG: homoserine dehydrogenase [Eubacteriales bacterium]
MKSVNIDLLGLGNVGSGVYKILSGNKKDIMHREGLDINIKKILVRDKTKKRLVDVPESLLTEDFNDIINDNTVSIIAESIGGVEPAKDYIMRAMKSGKSVVTANKELIAKHWPVLNKTAQDNGVGLYFEASVCGGIPIIRTIWDSLQANNFSYIMGIINGTTNYILSTMMEQGRDYLDVLKEAQAKGYAEPDPKNDVEGYDAVYKLSILSSLAFHARVPLEFIYSEGITNITREDIDSARELGYVIKLLAIGKKSENTIEVRVHPTMIKASHPLASVRDAFNAVFMYGSAVGEMMLYGKGAGDLPTGSAVVSDIIMASRCSEHRYTTFKNTESVSNDITFNNNWQSAFYVNMISMDRPGVLAKVAGIFAKYNVSVASVIQKNRNSSEVPLIFITHKAKEISFKQAISEIKELSDVIAIKNTIRVED